jgi:hypothetical protein
VAMVQGKYHRGWQVKPGRFATSLDARHDPLTRTWMLLSPLLFQRGNGDQILIPAGFHSNLASTKNAPGFPENGPWNAAAVVHDYLYEAEIFPRRISDLIFYEALRAIPSVPRWKAAVMYAAVVLLGGPHFPHSMRMVVAARQLAGIRDFYSRPLWRDGIARFV